MPLLAFGEKLFPHLENIFIKKIINQISVNKFIDAFDIISKLSVSDKSKEVINQLFMSNKFIDALEISSAESNFKLSSVPDHITISCESLWQNSQN